jgi:hypothetical protein
MTQLQFRVAAERASPAYTVSTHQGSELCAVFFFLSGASPGVVAGLGDAG